MKLDIPPNVIRTYEPGDAESITRHANNKKVADNMRDIFPHPYTLRDAKLWIRFTRREKPQRHFAIASAEEAFGGIGIFIQEDVYRQSGEMGYWLGETYWGRGIATKAVAAFSEFAFAEYGLVRVFAKVFASNPASTHVLEKAGFSFEGRCRKSITKNGMVMDDLLYAKIRE